jgi:putative transposase
VLGCYVGPANENDRYGVRRVLDGVVKKHSHIKKIFADMGYQGQELGQAIMLDYGIDLAIVKRPKRGRWVAQDTPVELLPTREEGFQVQPKRWIVERTFAWLGRNRRLAKEYDLLTASTENLIYLAMNRLMLRRQHA